MRINHIYITKEGEPMANPEMEYPKWGMSGVDIDRLHYAEVAEWKSGLLPFEGGIDKVVWECHDVFGRMPNQSNMINGDEIIAWRKTQVKPDTLIPVDIEVEVVTQKIVAHENSDKSWGPVVREGHKLFQYRKVLRIKP